MSRNLLLALLAVVACIAGYWAYTQRGAAEIINEKPKTKVIVAFGDSLSAGVGAPGKGFVDVLAQRLNMPIVNHGVPGNTTADGVKRLPTIPANERGGIVLLALGGNDLLRQHSTESMMKNLRAMIEQVQRDGGQVILVGIGGAPLRPSLTGEYRKLARETGCRFVPDLLGGILTDREKMADSIHPNAQGYIEVADKIEPVLREAITRAGW